MALLLVLWLTVLLSAVALEMKFSAHLRVQVTVSTGQTTKAFFLARSGVERAIADLIEGRDKVVTLASMREDSERTYQNVEIGDGAYTLYGGIGDDGEPIYGIIDEASKINLNHADAQVLATVPGIDALLADAIVRARQQQPYLALDDLLIFEGLDLLTIYGEDQNMNGLLDPNENDGDQSWPPDDPDDRLSLGLAAYLTAWSAARNVTADGEERVNLNEASAENIVQVVREINRQQAESIVAHREKSRFTSVADLLDVELVERVVEQPDGRQPPGRQPQERPTEVEEKPEGSEESKSENNETPEKESGDPGNPSSEAQEADKPKDTQPGEANPQVKTQGTGEKAFKMSDFRKIADFFTLQNEEVVQGIVNVNTASAEVLACLPGIDESLAQAIVRERNGRSEGFTTETDLFDVDGFSVDDFKQVGSKVSVRSDIFRARSYGVLDGGNVYKCVSAVIDRTEYEVRLVYWQEHE